MEQGNTPVTQIKQEVWHDRMTYNYCSSPVAKTNNNWTYTVAHTNKAQTWLTRVEKEMLENNHFFYISKSKGLNIYRTNWKWVIFFLKAENSIHHINNKQKLNIKYSHSQKQSSAPKNKK